MGRKNPENSPVAPSYGRNGALLETYGSTYTITRVVTLLGLALKKEPVNCRSCWRNLLTPPNVVTTRNLRNANAVPASQKNLENSPVAPIFGRNSSRGGGVIHAQLPPSQNLTNGVNRLGPKRSLLGDPNPNPCWPLHPLRDHPVVQYGRPRAVHSGPHVPVLPVPAGQRGVAGTQP